MHHTWRQVASAAGFVPSAPLAPTTIVTVVAVLAQAGYRSIPGMFALAKQAHVRAGHAWTAQLDLASRDALRGALRGQGPPKQSAAFPLERLSDLPPGDDPWVVGGPVGPVRALAVGCWWLLREIELSNILAKHVRPGESGTLEILLPTSKTDAVGVGVTRAHKCVCGGLGQGTPLLPRSMCPVCAVHTQLRVLRAQFGSPDRPLPGDLPLFPSKDGEVVAKTDMVATIRAGALSLGLPLSGHNGAPAWGGHALRRGGGSIPGEIRG